MNNANDILKMVYTVSLYTFPSLRASQRDVYEILPDGKVIIQHFEKGVRKALQREEKTVGSYEDYMQLCSRLNQCISHANRLEVICDDIGGELCLYREFGRKDILPRGYGDQNDTIESILSDYLKEPGLTQ